MKPLVNPIVDQTDQPEALPLRQDPAALVRQPAATVPADAAEPRAAVASSSRPLLVRMEDRSMLLAVEQIDWLEADDKYVKVHAGKQEYVMRDTLARLETVLDPAHFVRIHRSHIVQLHRLTELRALHHGKLEAVLRDGTCLCVSRVYLAGLADLFDAAK
jgi:two-component system LytT family response regulator